MGRPRVDRFEVERPRPAKRNGRPPALTPEQDAEVYEATRLLETVAHAALRKRYGVSNEVLAAAVKRESARRAGRRA